MIYHILSNQDHVSLKSMLIANNVQVQISARHEIEIQPTCNDHTNLLFDNFSYLT